jgi:hypothetical protein
MSTARSVLTAILSTTVLDDDPTFVNSNSLDVAAFREIIVYLTMLSASTPTTLQWIAQFSDDGGTTWYDYLQGPWASMFFEDTVMTSTITEAYSVPAMGRLFRLRAVATGSDGSKTFTISAKAEGRS